MIRLTRLNGSQLWMNADLIASVEACPDTTVTLVDGRHLVVKETAAEVVAEMTHVRACILALAEELIRKSSEADREVRDPSDSNVYLLPAPSDAERG